MPKTTLRNFTKILWAAGCFLGLQMGGLARGEEPDALTKTILGDWVTNGGFENGGAITINNDGTFTEPGGKAGGTWKWVSKERKSFEVDHGNNGAYAVTLSEDGSRATGKFVRGNLKIGLPVELVRKDALARPAPIAAPPSAPPPPTVLQGTPQEITAELVKLHRNNLVFVNGSNGSGSGFLAKYGTGIFLFTNAHVAAGVQGAGFKTLQGDQVKVGAAAVAVGHDIFVMQSSAAQPFEVMLGVDENAAIGDDIVVLGNAEGAGVINTIMGKIVGVGPNLVEVDAPFKPGNSGSPIIHLKSGKVIGLATYLTIRKFDSATKQPAKDPIVRRFGYRIDSVKKWQPVLWPTFTAQARQMEGIEALTEDLVNFLNNLGSGKIDSSRQTNPQIKNRIDAWLGSRNKNLSPRDRQNVDQNFISYLKVTCQSDIIAAHSQLTYDYFQRQVEEQERGRKEIADIFDKIIKDIQSGR